MHIVTVICKGKNFNTLFVLYQYFKPLTSVNLNDMMQGVVGLLAARGHAIPLIPRGCLPGGCCKLCGLRC